MGRDMVERLVRVVVRVGVRVRVRVDLWLGFRVLGSKHMVECTLRRSAIRCIIEATWTCDERRLAAAARTALTPAVRFVPRAAVDRRVARQLGPRCIG